MDTKYDAIIIGAGIGGLVCGCYLVKAGMKVLIVEKNDKPGGYCTSFKRDGFTFDACIHSLGSCRENGHLGRMFKELRLDKKIDIKRTNPSDLIITPDHKIAIRNNIVETITEFQENFPHQAKEIKDFFEYITNSNFTILYIQLQDKTFKDLLDQFFKDPKLKATLSIFSGNMGLPSSMASALAAVILYREFVLDGGYYPIGGMQALSNALSERLQEFGGKLLLSNLVKKIKLKDKKVEGIMLQGANFVQSRYVVSNCDAAQTFLKLIGEEHLEKIFVKKLKKMIPSVSAFIVYLGINRHIKNILQYKCNLWYSTSYNIDDTYLKITQGDIDYPVNCLLLSFPSFHDQNLAPQGKESVILLFNSPYKDREFWEKNKFQLANNAVKRAENVIPNLSEYVDIEDIATSSTLYRYTLNNKGAAYGWASISSQIEKTVMPQRTFLTGLFLAGHWTTQGSGQGGISTVVRSGKETAKLIMEQEKLNKRNYSFQRKV